MLRGSIGLTVKQLSEVCTRRRAFADPEPLVRSDPVANPPCVLNSLEL
jgi:hypothetical protein